MKEISEITPIYLSEELISTNPEHLEITFHTGRLPRIGEKRAKELFGEVITSIVVEDKEQEISNLKAIDIEKVQTEKGLNIFNMWFELLITVVCISFCANLVKLPPFIITLLLIKNPSFLHFIFELRINHIILRHFQFHLFSLHK